MRPSEYLENEEQEKNDDLVKWCIREREREIGEFSSRESRKISYSERREFNA